VAFEHPVSHEQLEIAAPPPQEVLWDYFVASLNEKL
jgi:hypothetical protein